MQIQGHNLEPKWGLFNSALGVVKDIVFANGCNPNHGDMPEYVLVDFPHYIGPAFIKQHPTFVPIAPTSMTCKHRCCKHTYLPLEICWAKTIHTFQGFNAGPSAPNQPPNMIRRIIVDPGTKQFEGNNPGLFYTIMTRATTLGTNKMDSAIYFTGWNMTKERIKNITRGQHGKVYKKVFLRS